MRIGLYLAKLEETPSASSSIYTEREREYCLRRRNPHPHLAGRFAAKKAVCVALDLDTEFPLKDIEVARERGKAPTIHFHGRARFIASRAGTPESHVSISHSGNYAVALVVLE
jgi:holo-[acyl-carrier protein] synthase